MKSRNWTKAKPRMKFEEEGLVIVLVGVSVIEVEGEYVHN